MAPWAWRIGCKPEGRSEVVVMAGGCAGAYLRMVRCSLCAPCDVEPAFRGAAHEADKRPARHRVSDEGEVELPAPHGLRGRSCHVFPGFRWPCRSSPTFLIDTRRRDACLSCFVIICQIGGDSPPLQCCSRPSSLRLSTASNCPAMCKVVEI